MTRKIGGGFNFLETLTNMHWFWELSLVESAGKWAGTQKLEKWAHARAVHLVPKVQQCVMSG